MSEADADETVVFLSQSRAQTKRVNLILLRALLRMLAPSLLLSAGLRLLTVCLTFCGTLLLKAILAYLEGDSPHSWHGYACAGGMLAAGALLTCVQQQYSHTVFRMGMQLRTVLTLAVYRKSLRLSSAARRTANSGSVVNLMSVDAFKLQDFAAYVNVLWSAPLQMCVCLWLLYRELGAAVFAGLAVLLLLIPFNGVMSKYMKRFQLQQMALKDARVKLVAEILAGIRVIKLYAWELAFANQVDSIRSKEVGVMRRSAFLNAGISFAWGCTPVLVSLTTFAVYTLASDSNVLDAEKCFVSLSLFNLLRSPLTMLPMVVNTAVECSVSVRRLTDFLTLEEVAKDAVAKDAGLDVAVRIADGRFSWGEGDGDGEGEGDEATLDGVNLSFEEGALVAIVGDVGSGKSSLLQAVLGCMRRLRGSVSVKGSLAYASQEPFIQNLSLRDNVLFNSPLQPRRYADTLRRCGLDPDVSALPAGDMTEIGERGVTLSGGQKARVALARACYADRDVYLLDDPLSAVDVHVGQHIFKEVLSSDTGCLRAKTRLLVTHSLTHLPHVDKIVVMRSGRVSEVGTFRQLMEARGPFAALVDQFLANRGVSSSEEDVEAVLTILDCIQKEEEKEAERTEAEQTEAPQSMATEPAVQQLSSALSSSSSQQQQQQQQQEAEAEVACCDSSFSDQQQRPVHKVTMEERQLTGRVSWRVYAEYFRAVGLHFCLGVVATYACSHCLALGANFWLADWTDDAGRANWSLGNSSGGEWTRAERIGVLSLFGLMQVGATILAELLVASGGLRAARRLHSRLLLSLLRQPAASLHCPRQLLQAFADDLGLVEARTPANFRYLTLAVCSLAERAVALCLLNAVLCLQLAATVAVLGCLQRLYIPSSRQLKRLEALAKSPIFSHFSETLNGATSIRAFEQQATFKRTCSRLVDNYNRCYYPNGCAARWLTVWLEMIGHLIVTCTCVFGVVSRHSVSPGIVGLAVIYTLNVTQGLSWLIRMASELETNIVSVERIKEYSQLEQEAAWYSDNEPPLPADWPGGSVQFSNFACSYPRSPTPALADVSLSIGAGERVGVVGRTGSGKSTLALALFRVLEAERGRLLIGGVDISQLGLQRLRSSVTLIPQDPLLFAASLRWNLDPFSAHTDQELWSALATAHLLAWAKSLPDGLQYPIAEGGVNVSLGQRQLLCLARALLRSSRLLVLDEATAAVDMRTDALVQATVREKFANATLLTVAHRINTVMDYDRIVVLEAGRVQECGPPAELLANGQSAFRAMAAEAGLLQ